MAISSRIRRLVAGVVVLVTAAAALQLASEYLRNRQMPAEAVGPAPVGPAPTQDERELADSSAELAPDAAVSAAANVSNNSSTAIPIPAELTAFVGNDPNLRVFHGLLEREPMDEAWARRLEQRFRDHIEASMVATGIIVQQIRCRTYSCELLATGYSASAAEHWTRSMTELFDSGAVNEWARGTGEGRCGYGTVAPEVFVLHCIYSQDAAISDQTMPEQELSLADPHPGGVAVVAVDVPPRVAAVIESDARVYALHRELETEARDAAWAEPLETRIARDFNNLPDLDSLTVTRVECRATLCEVQLRLDDPPMHPVWLEKVSAFHGETWHDVRTARMSASGFDDERMDIVWMLRRQ